MVVAEHIIIDGRDFIRTWSDAGKRIEREGAVYDEAYDPAECERVYTETDEDIVVTAEDALAELMGVLE